MAASAGFFSEIGMNVVLCVSGGRTGGLAGHRVAGPNASGQTIVLADSDFAAAQEAARDSARGPHRRQQQRLPVGAGPRCAWCAWACRIHDRLGGGPILPSATRGTRQLHDRVVNALLEAAQDGLAVGYTHW